MRSARVTGDGSGMASTQTTRLTLELDSVVEPITGRMRAEAGPSRHFVGWLGLAAALRGALGEAAARPDRVSEPGTRPAAAAEAE